MDDDWVTLSALEHHAYCPRQARLLQDGVWADNYLTVQGTAAHARVDTPGVDSRRGVRVHHRVALASKRLRLYGVADSIEQHPNGSWLPVEHKWGRGTGDLRPLIMQVTGQALCLEEMKGVEVPAVAVYIVSERRRETFPTAEWRTETEREIEALRRGLNRPMGVRPQYISKLCRRCSVLEVCQPVQEA